MISKTLKPKKIKMFKENLILDDQQKRRVNSGQQPNYQCSFAELYFTVCWCEYELNQQKKKSLLQKAQSKQVFLTIIQLQQLMHYSSQISECLCISDLFYSKINLKQIEMEPLPISSKLFEQNYPQWCVVTCNEECQSSFYYYGFMVSAFFSVLTILICLYNAAMHFTHFNNPYFQAKIILIILMPPAYCITSTFSFLSVKLSSYITLARDSYEVVGLLAFVYLILAFLAYDNQKNQMDQKLVYTKMIQSSSQVPHDYPCNYFQKPYQLSNWRKAKYFTNRCKRGVFQYLLVKIVSSVFLVVVYPNYQLRDRQQNDWDYQVYNQVNTYLYWIGAISCYIAYYYMTLLYNSLQQKLKSFKPDLKFMTFNAAMYYTYWQKVWIVFFQNELVSCFDQSPASFSSKKLLYCIENFLICIEMFIMALAALEAYNYQDYVVTKGRNRFGSLFFIIKDSYSIFINELKLFKPKSIGFRSTKEQQERELIAIASTKPSYINNIKRPLFDCFNPHYF